MVDLLTRQLTIMTMDGTRLAVPLSSSVTIERTVQLQPGETAGQVVGTILSRNQRYPVYALSRHLAVLAELPAQRAFCVCLEDEHGPQRLAIACDTVTPVRLDHAARIQLLPTCMQATGTPLQGLCTVAQQLVLVSSAEALGAYLLGKE
jgi:hypothetical protein